MMPRVPFDTNHQTPRVWLNELTHELGWDDSQHAYGALRAVLHAIRNRLTVEETVDFGAQLPMPIRGLYYEGWMPKATPGQARTNTEFLAQIAAGFEHDGYVDPEAIARAVFKMLQRYALAGDLGDMTYILPADIRSLCPQGGSRPT